MSSIYDWSTTAANNGTADSGINFAEGQAPSTVNNSARALMGRVAEFIDDLGSNLTVGGTANAITITANSSFDTYATGLRMVFKAGSDNSGTATLNVNSIGAKAIRKIAPDGDADVASGDIQSGSLYEVIYSTSLNSGAGGWQLMNLPLPAEKTNGMPVGGVVPYFGTTAPDEWLFCYGQAVSRSTYSALYSSLGETYGAGDGSTTFNLPDLRGRAPFGKDDMGGTSANRITDQSGGWNGDTLGDTGGEETVTLTTTEIPSHTHAVGTLATASGGAHTHSIQLGTSAIGDADGGDGRILTSNLAISPTVTSSYASALSNGAHTHTLTGSTASAGSGGAHNNLPPGIVCNYIIYAGA